MAVESLDSGTILDVLSMKLHFDTLGQGWNLDVLVLGAIFIPCSRVQSG